MGIMTPPPIKVFLLLDEILQCNENHHAQN